jgi:hypothetical protein
MAIEKHGFKPTKPRRGDIHKISIEILCLSFFHLWLVFCTNQSWPLVGVLHQPISPSPLVGVPPSTNPLADPSDSLLLFCLNKKVTKKVRNGKEVLPRETLWATLHVKASVFLGFNFPLGRTYLLCCYFTFGWCSATNQSFRLWLVFRHQPILLLTQAILFYFFA